MTFAYVSPASGAGTMVPNICRNAAGGFFQLSNFVKNSSGTNFLVFRNVVPTTTPTGQIFTATDERVFIA